MSEGKKRKYDGKFKERAVVLAKERQNVAQAAREPGVSEIKKKRRRISRRIG